MPIEKHTITTREDWLKLRLNDLTASDLGAYLGLTPWKSPAELMAEKRGLSPQLASESRVMRRGRRDEYAILRIIAEQRPTWSISESKVYLRDPSIRLGATPDAVAVDPEREGIGVIQCKSVAADVFARSWVQEDESVEIPLPYLLQTLCEAHLAEASWAVLAVWVRSAWTEDLHILPVIRDERAEENVRDLAVRFWKDCDSGKLPEFGHKNDSKTVELFFPKEREDQKEPTDWSGDNEARGLIDEYIEIRERAKIDAERKGEIATQLKEKLGYDGSAKVDGYSVSWKTTNRKETVVKASSFRTLRVAAPRKPKGDR